MLHLVFMGKFRTLAPDALDAARPPDEVATLNDLCHWVGQQSPALGAALTASPFKLIVNHAVVHDLSTNFKPGDEVAFLPPMSGG